MSQVTQGANCPIRSFPPITWLLSDWHSHWRSRCAWLSQAGAQTLAGKLSMICCIRLCANFLQMLLYASNCLIALTNVPVHSFAFDFFQVSFFCLFAQTLTGEGNRVSLLGFFLRPRPITKDMFYVELLKYKL